MEIPKTKLPLSCSMSHNDASRHRLLLLLVMLLLLLTLHAEADSGHAQMMRGACHYERTDPHPLRRRASTAEAEAAATVLYSCLPVSFYRSVPVSAVCFYLSFLVSLWYVGYLFWASGFFVLSLPLLFCMSKCLWLSLFFCPCLSHAPSFFCLCLCLSVSPYLVLILFQFFLSVWLPICTPLSIFSILKSGNLPLNKNSGYSALSSINLVK